MKLYLDNVIGNNSIKERLSHDIENSSISHAFIFEGENGSGRHTLALNLAAAICCENKGGERVPCCKCPSCSRILSGRSPDIITTGLADDKASIGIEAARFIKNDIHISPNGLPIKMYIVENADKMTVQAQNALLLSIEEPPPYVIFILLCTDSSLLLETIRSRAPLLRLERLSGDDVAKYLLKNKKKAVQLSYDSPADFNELVMASRGTIGRAVSLLDESKRNKEFSEIAIGKAFMELSLERSKVKIFEMLELLGKKRPEVVPRLSRIQHAIRDLILLKKTDSPELIFYSDIEYASELSAKFTLERLMDMYSAVDLAIEDLKANANVRLALLAMMYNCKLCD